MSITWAAARRGASERRRLLAPFDWTGVGLGGTLIGLLLPGERVADPDRRSDGPFDDAHSARDAEADQKPCALVFHMSDYGQVYAGTSLGMAVLLVTVVCGAARWRATAGICLCLRIHYLMLPGRGWPDIIRSG